MGDKPEDLLQRILYDRPPEPTREDKLTQMLTRHFDQEKNKVLLRFTLWSVVSVLLIVYGVRIMSYTEDIRSIMLALVVIVAGLLANVIMKTWYWILDTKISVIREAKRTQLMLAQGAEGELAHSDALASEGAFPEEPLDERIPFNQRISYKTAQRLSRLALFLLAVGSVVLMFPSLQRISLAAMGMDREHVDQTDEWYLGANGTVTVRSKLVYDRAPQEPAFIRFSLPYAAGEVQSVTANGNAGPFTKLNWREYEVETPVRWFTEAKPTLEVNWTLPVSALEVSSGFLQTRLQPIVPARSYELNVVLEPGAPYLPLVENSTRYRAFYQGRIYPEGFLGSCGLAEPLPETTP